jgi:hypothetical protein
VQVCGLQQTTPPSLHEGSRLSVISPAPQEDLHVEPARQVSATIGEQHFVPPLTLQKEPLKNSVTLQFVLHVPIGQVIGSIGFGAQQEPK